MPASVEPRRSFPAVVVSRSRSVEPCSVLLATRDEALQCKVSRASVLSSFTFPTADSLFSAYETPCRNINNFFFFMYFALCYIHRK